MDAQSDLGLRCPHMPEDTFSHDAAQFLLVFIFMDQTVVCALESNGTVTWEIMPLGYLFVCVEVLRPSQLNGVMSSAVSLPNHTFTGQA